VSPSEEQGEQVAGGVHRGSMGRERFMRGDRQSRVFESLNLTDEQKASVDGFREKLREDTQKHTAELQRLRVAYSDELNKENFAKQKEIVDDIMKEETEIEKLRIDFMVNVNSVLTQEQKNKLRELRNKPRERSGGEQ
jgi:Spy/CpxP family protein refolding chaperone